MSAPSQPDDRQDVHNVSVDEDVSRAGGCGQINLATGATCALEHGHQGSCDFAPRDQAVAGQGGACPP